MLHEENLVLLWQQILIFVARFTNCAATRNATKLEKTTLIGSAENMANDTAGNEVEFLDTQKMIYWTRNRPRR